MKAVDELMRLHDAAVDARDGHLYELHEDLAAEDAAEKVATAARDALRSAIQDVVSEWRTVDRAPSDEPVLLYCPDRGPTNEARIEVAIYRNSRSGSMHAWATHWQPLPEPPEGEGE